MKKGRHRRFEEARAMKRSNEIDVDAIFRIDDLLETDEEGEVPPEHQAWFDEYGASDHEGDGGDPEGDAPDVDAEERGTEAEAEAEG